MKSLQTYIKAAVVCAIVNAIYTYCSFSASFLDHAVGEEVDMSRFELFLHNSELIEDFWPHIFLGWAHTFTLSLVSCVVLLLWLVLGAHTKQRNSASGDDASPPVR